MIAGSALPVTAIEYALPGAPMWNALVCTPASAFAFTMNWRSEPWTERSGFGSSSPSSALVITLEAKPKSTPVASPPAIEYLMTCSAVASDEASSDVPWPRRSRPP